MTFNYHVKKDTSKPTLKWRLVVLFLNKPMVEMGFDTSKELFDFMLYLEE